MLVLMDISLPDGNGLEMARTILDEMPGAWILTISAHGPASGAPA